MGKPTKQRCKTTNSLASLFIFSEDVEDTSVFSWMPSTLSDDEFRLLVETITEFLILLSISSVFSEYGDLLPCLFINSSSINIT